MYTLTFNRATLDDLLAHSSDGRQLYAAIVIPNSGIFTRSGVGSNIEIPKIVCPYQVNDIIAIQEQWARDNSKYIYKTGDPEKDSGYSFRPAETMPVEASRLHARIVSIVPWPVTQDILKNYLTIGNFSNSYDGTAKVIDYYDNGTRLLSSVRSTHNRSVLLKSAQPQVYSDPPLVDRTAYYYLKQEYTYMCRLPNGSLVKGATSLSAQAYDDNPTRIMGNKPVDANGGRWALVTRDNPNAESTEKNIKYVGEASWSSESNPVYIYLSLDSNGLARPVYASYKTKSIDPNLRWYCWMISAYLSDKQGNIIGNWF